MSASRRTRCRTRHISVPLYAGEGKKSPYSGYYFQTGVRGESDFEGGNMLAVVDYRMEPKALRVMREDISMGEGEFGRILSLADSRFSIDSTDALKRSPVGYPSDCQDAEYLKLRKFCICYCPDDDFMTSPVLLDRTVELFSTATPVPPLCEPRNRVLS